MRIGIVALVAAAVLFVFVVFTATPDDAYAHGSGLTLSATTTSYFVDVDYADFAVYQNESGRFDLKLFTDPDRTKAVDFSQVFVRITQKGELPEGDTIFSGWLVKAAFGPTGFSIALPRAGEYLMTVRFAQSDKTIEAATLPFSVTERPSSSAPLRTVAIYVVIALCVLAAAASIVITRRRR